MIIPDEHLFAQLDIHEVPPLHGVFAMQMPVSRPVMNNRGGLQGGLVATLVDVAAGCALVRELPAGMSAATADLNLHFLSAVRVGPAQAEVTVARQGKHSSVLQVDVYDVGRDVRCAIGTVTFTLIELRPEQRDVRTTDLAANLT